MSEINLNVIRGAMRPEITIAFECPENIHTDHFIKLHKKIIASKLYAGNMRIHFKNLNMDGDIKTLLNQIDSTGALYAEFEEKNACAQ